MNISIPLVVIAVVIVAGIIALIIFRSRSMSKDRRKRDEDSKR
jgi:hypothetical protein